MDLRQTVLDTLLESSNDTYGNFRLVKTKEKKNTIAHPNGAPIYELKYKEETVGKFEPYSSYKEKKTGSKTYVDSRKDVSKYQYKPNDPEIEKKIPIKTRMGWDKPWHSFSTLSFYYKD